MNLAHEWPGSTMDGRRLTQRLQSMFRGDPLSNNVREYFVRIIKTSTLKMLSATALETFENKETSTFYLFLLP